MIALCQTKLKLNKIYVELSTEVKELKCYKNITVPARSGQEQKLRKIEHRVGMKLS